MAVLAAVAATPVEDLDAPVARRSGPDAAARVRRRPRAQLVAVALATAVAGVLLQHVRAVHEVRRELDAAAASVVASEPTGALGPAGPPGAGGWSRYRVRVPLMVQGPVPVRATVLRVDTPHQRAGRVPPVQELARRVFTTVELPLQVRCADVPAPDAPDPDAPVPDAPDPDAPVGDFSGTTTVTVRVEVAGGRRDVRLRVPRTLHDADPLVAQLWAACAYGGLARG